MIEEENKIEKNMHQNNEQNSHLDIHNISRPPIFDLTQGEQDLHFNLLFCILTVILKILPIVLFFTATNIKILGFTLVLIAASVDFWVIKNIGGRQLVGMIWWMRVNVENGDQEWIFHSSDGYSIDKINEGVFWGSLLIGNVFWGITSLLSIILSSVFWISLCLFCLMLGLLNFRCFMRCQGQHRQKIKQLADKVGLASAHSLVGDY